MNQASAITRTTTTPVNLVYHWMSE